MVKLGMVDPIALLHFLDAYPILKCHRSTKATCPRRESGCCCSLKTNWGFDQLIIGNTEIELSLKINEYE
jgi:hypothetical protein